MKYAILLLTMCGCYGMGPLPVQQPGDRELIEYRAHHCHAGERVRWDGEGYRCEVE